MDARPVAIAMQRIHALVDASLIVTSIGSGEHAAYATRLSEKCQRTRTPYLIGTETMAPVISRFPCRLNTKTPLVPEDQRRFEERC